ncbi:MAG TPA: hypothetical protein VK902_04020 [Rubrobacter sp.]|jgi:hypothetical protein|nr:hypothetical protein [Rubrobacter sp.]
MTQGTVKDNVRDELNEAGARGSEASWLWGVKDNVQDERSESFR